MGDRRDAIDELESAPFMQDPNDPRGQEAYERVWSTWERLVNEGKLTAIDLMRLKAFAQAVYDLGTHEGACNSYC